MKTIAFMWLVTIAAVWVRSAIKYYLPDAWWSFPLYFTILLVIAALIGWFLIRERGA